LYKISGNFVKCGKLYSEIASIYEQENQNTKAAENYFYAYQYFELDGKRMSDSVKCLCKYADLNVQSDKMDLNNLLETYDKIIDYYQSEKLGKYQLKYYIMMSLITIMAMRLENDSIKNKYEHYMLMDYSFASSSHGILINGIIQAIENNDVELFETSCYNYDRVKPLEPYMITLLTIVKKQISNGDSDGEIDLC
jgi:hypothetical protein